MRTRWPGCRWESADERSGYDFRCAGVLPEDASNVNPQRTHVHSVTVLVPFDVRTIFSCAILPQEHCAFGGELKSGSLGTG